MTPGSRVRVTLPADVPGWSHPPGATWIGVVVTVNGDSIDVQDEAGVVEPIDREYVRAIRGPRPGSGGRPRKGSAKQSRDLTAHVSEAEHADVTSRVEAAGLSISGYLRAALGLTGLHRPN